MASGGMSAAVTDLSSCKRASRIKSTAVHMVKVKLWTKVILPMQIRTRLDGCVDALWNAWARRKHAGHASCGYLQSLLKDGNVIAILQPDIQVKDVLVISSTCSVNCSKHLKKQSQLVFWDQRQF